jgi:tetratricopeptide (TPR) repeat protein
MNEIMIDRLKLFQMLGIVLILISCSDKKINSKAIELNNSATELMMDKKFNDALVLLDKAIGIQNDYLIAYANKLSVYIQMGDFNGALSVSEKIKSVFPENSYGYMYSGMLSEKLGDNTRARDEFNELVDIYKNLDLYSEKIDVQKSYCISLKLAKRSDELELFISKLFQESNMEDDERLIFEKILKEPRSAYFDSRLK